ncbi:ISLre2 family transposase [Neobacillus sp. SM06]|uniref:ISLre2 family transposase n=1 Tax=Neobacillus sp. SM06 TaxID=3422492 RepID=UPI003D2D33D9
MEKIITKIYKLIKESENLIILEERLQLLMYEVFSQLLGEVFNHMNQAIVKEKQKADWKVERNDPKTVQFTFGTIRFNHTLMHDNEGHPVYPFDELLGLRKHQRYSPLVEVKVAELASQNAYREVARTLKEWTAVTISHQTVGKMVKSVGGAQAKADEELVLDLEEAASLPEAKKVDFLMAEADGVFVRSTKRRKNIEVHHAITYEGWDINGKRVSLREPKVIMTTQRTDVFWSQVQATTAHRYSLENTQVVTNSDGGLGYTADKFQGAFSQSRYKVWNQLDSYHISQSLNRTFGVKSDWKDKVKKAIDDHDMDAFTVCLDTYESTLEDSKQLEKLKAFRWYIGGNWDRIFDWRNKVKNLPENARNLGAMESNQRHVSFRMKKRGMHWSYEGAEAMVKIKQGILNQTLREVYLKHQHKSARKQREVKKAVRMSQILHQATRPSIGAKNGRISLHAPHSTAMGQLVKSMSL